MSDLDSVRAGIAVAFNGMVGTIVVFLPGFWVLAVIVATAIVVFGLVGLEGGVVGKRGGGV